MFLLKHICFLLWSQWQTLWATIWVHSKTFKNTYLQPADADLISLFIAQGWIFLWNLFFFFGSLFYFFRMCFKCMMLIVLKFLVLSDSSIQLLEEFGLHHVPPNLPRDFLLINCSNINSHLEYTEKNTCIFFNTQGKHHSSFRSCAPSPSAFLWRKIIPPPWNSLHLCPNTYLHEICGL